MNEATETIATEKAWAEAWAKLEDKLDTPPTLGALRARRLGRLRPVQFYEGFNSPSDCLEGPAEPDTRVER